MEDGKMLKLILAMDRVGELMKCSGKTMEEMLAGYAEAYLMCEDCIFYNECSLTRSDCVDIWKDYLMLKRGKPNEET